MSIMRSQYWPARVIQGIIGAVIASLVMVLVGFAICEVVGVIIDWVEQSFRMGG